MKSVIRQLKTLRTFKPHAGWTRQQWEILSRSLTGTQVTLNVWQKFVHVLEHPAVFRPLGNLAVILIMLFAGSWSALAFAQQSVPGSLLYSVKVGIEKVDLALTVDTSARATKQSDIAKERANEFTTLASRAHSLPQSPEIDQAVQNIKHNIEQAQSSLNALAGEQGNGKAAKAAVQIEQNVEHITKAVAEAASTLPTEVRATLNDDLEEVNEALSQTKNQALEVVFTKGLLDGSVSENEIVVRLHKELENARIQKEQVLAIGLTIADRQGASAEQIVDRQAALALQEEKLESLIKYISEQIVNKDYVGALSSLQAVRMAMKEYQTLSEASFELELPTDESNKTEAGAVKGVEEEGEVEENSQAASSSTSVNAELDEHGVSGSTAGEPALDGTEAEGAIGETGSTTTSIE